jgi:GntR family transcriptional regulator, transcriptional repressor for pyruvate dehydrogenase complex
MTEQLNGKGDIRPVEGLATELVVGHVRGQILRGELRKGERLPPERELIRELGVSRTTVRAGLQSLVAKGVLVTRHGAGTFVADGPPRLDSDALTCLAALHGFSSDEMFEARRSLETGVAGMAAERAKPHEVAAISDEVTSMFASLDDPQTFLIHDIRFHRAVATASGNPILATLVEMVSALFYEQRRRTADRAHDLRPTADMHLKIYKAIRDRQRARAESLMCGHLEQAQREQETEVAQSASDLVATTISDSAYSPGSRTRS